MSNPSSPSAYLQYLISYEKNLTRLADEGRYLAFEKSYNWIEKKIAELNQSSYSVVVNQFSDWTQDEISSMFPSLNYTEELKNRYKASPTYEFSDEDREYLLASSATGDSLNWATDNNPYGMGFLPYPRNQGTCGACWAFVAVGSAEGAVGIATKQKVSLSVQQLIDCSTVFNRGCNGGNPIYAYDYMRQYGVATWSEYPYIDGQDPSCMSTDGFNKAYIHGDLSIPPNDEVELKWYVGKGPVAIGICGTDMDFMYYGGGIFDPTSCCSAQNHAVLLVGYGVDAQSGTNYWVIQNSWGTQWGEGGYMRIKRSTVRGAGPGVCGLATFPTMALGGKVVSGNASSPSANQDQTIGEWLLDHNQQIISVFAATCFVLSIVLLILSYWLSCRRREHERLARSASVSKAKIEALRSRGGSFDSEGSTSRTPNKHVKAALSRTDINYLHQKLSSLPQHRDIPDGYYNDEDVTELSGLLDGKRVLCKTNLTPFSSVANSRVGSRVGSRAGSPINYGAINEEDDGDAENML